MYRYLQRRLGSIANAPSLAWVIIDGLLWAIMFSLAESFIIPWAIYKGASPSLIGILSGSGPLAVIIGQLIGQRLLSRGVARKPLCLWATRCQAASWLILLVATELGAPLTIVPLIFGLSIFAANLSAPGWLAWMGDLVPPNARGSYWGLRNKLISLVQFSSLLLGGVLLWGFKRAGYEGEGYATLFLLAAVSRAFSFIPLRHTNDPGEHTPPTPSTFSFRVFLTKLTTTNFGWFVVFTVLLTFTVHFMSPVIPIFILTVHRFNYLEFTILTMAPMIATAVAMTYWGTLADRFGNYRILQVTAAVTPIFGAFWAILPSVPALLVLQLFAGFVWAGFNLCTVNYIFDAVRRENISKVMSYFNALTNFAAMVGSVSGGFTLTWLQQCELPLLPRNAAPFIIVFLLSSFFRIIIVLGFSRRFREVRTIAEHQPPVSYFYIYRPKESITSMLLNVGILPRRDEKRI